MFIPANTKYFYKGLPLAEWCRRNGVDYRSVTQRYEGYRDRKEFDCSIERAVQATLNYKTFKQKIIDAGGDIKSYRTIWDRVFLHGWSFERAIKEPVNIKYRRKNGTGQIQNETIEH